MGEMRESECGNDVATKVQHYGVLSKKPFGHPSSKWAKRFFIIKDGVLLYYPDSERKDFEKRRFFNIHPKGIVPLGGCAIQPCVEPAHPFAINIISDEINGNMMLAAESEFERDRWVNTLKQACRVTWRNVEVGESIIQQLETHGLQMAKEKQHYFDKLQNEAMALHDERLKTEELEKIKADLEEEKQDMERLAAELREEYSRIKTELDETGQAMKAVEDDKRRLHQSTDDLQCQLELLQGEKQRVTTELQEWHATTQQLSLEKQNLSQTTASMQVNLEEIEVQTSKLQEEKAAFEKRLLEKEKQEKQLRDEKEAITVHAQQLQESIKDLCTQKAATEAELKEEILARLDAERRLKEAEQSLARLDRAVNQNPEDEVRDETEVREEMIGDVKTLKRFFENLAFETKIDADKTILIKSSLSARRTCVRRAQTLRYEAHRKRRARSSDCFNAASFVGPSTPMPLSTVSENNLFELSLGLRADNDLFRDFAPRHDPISEASESV